MSGLLEGKVAIITGGTSGIGAASARLFVAEGARVVIAGRRDEVGQRTEEASGGAIRYHHSDVTNEGEVKALVADTVSWFGKLDVFFGNAGTVGGMAPIQEVSTTDFDEVLALDVYSTLWGHKYAARQLLAQGTGGSIITTSSLAGLQASWGGAPYTTAKHAVNGIVRQAAADLGSRGIRCNAIAAGVVITPMLARTAGFPVERTDEVNAIIQGRLGPKQSNGRFATAEDIANVALFLASDLSTHVNGVILPVDGGTFAMTQNTFNQDMTAIRSELLGV
jgi:NAD(P)-dependent dehydrogenase (short-subunit alcohol dehydrogenase family)